MWPVAASNCSVLLLGKAVTNCVHVLEIWEEGVGEIGAGVSKPDLQARVNYSPCPVWKMELTTVCTCQVGGKN